MNKPTLFLLGCVAWISVCSFVHDSWAQQPLSLSQTKEVWSPNRRFCAVMNRESKTAVVYRIEQDGCRTRFWTMEGWFRVAHLSDDGEHLVVGHDGIDLLPTNVTKEEPMIRFFSRGTLLSTVTLGELVTDISNLKHTGEHYRWGRYLGFDPFEAKDIFVVETLEGRKLAFDVTNGRITPPIESTFPVNNDVASSSEQGRKDVYIPKDLDDCFVELRKILPEKTVEEMKTGTEKDMIQYHHGLGTWLRNNWGLWEGSRLSKWFNEKGIRHPDDMSGIIFDSFWRHLNGHPIRLDEQIKRYQGYWKRLEDRKNAK